MSYNMAKKAARTPSINRALLRRSPTWSITAVARTIRRARGWDGNKTLPSGQKLVACFRPFLEYLVTCASVAGDHPEARRDEVCGDADCTLDGVIHRAALRMTCI